MMEGKFGVKRGEQHLAALDTLIASVCLCLYVGGKITVCRFRSNVGARRTSSRV